MDALRPYKPKKRYVPKVKRHEDSLQRQVCTYLRMQYPSVIFRSDYAGTNMESKYQRAKHTVQSSRGFPDLFIYRPMQHKKRYYCGLALELKREGTPIIMKIGPRKGRLSSDRHIQEQAVVLKALIAEGYYANFAIGLDDAIKQIDWYMQKPQTAELF